jgi:hypothetical protein
MHMLEALVARHDKRRSAELARGPESHVPPTEQSSANGPLAGAD